MKTFALLFSIETYNRTELDRMTARELYNLASVAASVGYDEVSVYSLEELSDAVNEGLISVDGSWLYFVSFNE